MYFFSVRIC